MLFYNIHGFNKMNHNIDNQKRNDTMKNILKKGRQEKDETETVNNNNASDYQPKHQGEDVTKQAFNFKALGSKAVSGIKQMPAHFRQLSRSRQIMVAVLVGALLIGGGTGISYATRTGSHDAKTMEKAKKKAKTAEDSKTADNNTNADTNAGSTAQAGDGQANNGQANDCLLYTSPSPRDRG